LHQFIISYTPKPNVIVEKKNWTLVEAAQNVLHIAQLPKLFWAKTISTTCYIQNQILIFVTKNSPLMNFGNMLNQHLFICMFLDVLILFKFLKKLKKNGQ
jgi:hypothetical protein